ncbi:MAG: hypothetical protein IJS74_03235 [Clostridia bacterium]|nr:hypothetical protein [Clostridia bacterium]
MADKKENVFYNIKSGELQYIMKNASLGFIGEQHPKQLELHEYCYFTMLHLVDISLKEFLENHPEFKNDKAVQNRQIRCILDELRQMYYFKLKRAFESQGEGDVAITRPGENSVVSSKIDIKKFNPFLTCHFANLLGWTYNDVRAQRHGECCKIETVIDLMNADAYNTTMIPNYKENEQSGEFYDVMLPASEKDLFVSIKNQIENANSDQPSE